MSKLIQFKDTAYFIHTHLLLNLVSIKDKVFRFQYNSEIQLVNNQIILKEKENTSSVVHLSQA